MQDLIRIVMAVRPHCSVQEATAHKMRERAIHHMRIWETGIALEITTVPYTFDGASDSQLQCGEGVGTHAIDTYITNFLRNQLSHERKLHLAPLHHLPKLFSRHFQKMLVDLAHDRSKPISCLSSY